MNQRHPNHRGVWFLPELNVPAIAAITTAINDAPPQFRVLMVLYNLSHQSDLGSPRIHDRLSLAKPSVAPFVCMNRIRSLMGDPSLRDQAFQSSTELHQDRFQPLWNYVRYQ